MFCMHRLWSIIFRRALRCRQRFKHETATVQLTLPVAPPHAHAHTISSFTTCNTASRAQLNHAFNKRRCPVFAVLPGFPLCRVLACDCNDVSPLIFSALFCQQLCLACFATRSSAYSSIAAFWYIDGSYTSASIDFLPRSALMFVRKTDVVMIRHSFAALFLFLIFVSDFAFCFCFCLLFLILPVILSDGLSE